MKKEIPLAITFLTGVIIVVTFFIPHQPLGGMQQRLLIWYSIVLGFTLLLGVDSLLRSNLQKIMRRAPGWPYAVVVVAGFLATLAAGIHTWATTKDLLSLGSSFMYIYTYMIVPLQATMFALLAFFIASAAYRAFRARTLEATLLLVTAAIVMLGRVPVGAEIWDKLPGLQDWIMEIPQMAAKRGIFIGVALGTIAMSLRVILGLERTYLS
ncbi:MAG: hypothetical protein MUF78_00065 [Candidatus Edwardsbacteria bacterium]|jgi:hypothetical protein|nr:hypothetical protein [Candidatus Edwardsbacteria bacterium]